ncbi:gp89 [Alphaproteobacteria phage PhiJL001]|uniref:Gp89 n=1 Tax=Alphaproteobacteria phage PhiJL001 TaxID=2681607 RepID=Q5DN16_9CAUD|nr:gp89 [Alphaproteobacteria phage PhiJL001]AAT69480.1 gp89 [Alphaproteobacteria phage PhiJL001]
MLTLNTGLGFPAMVTMAILGLGTDVLGILAGAYASLLATWAVAAGIRQWGKSNGSEKETWVSYSASEVEVDSKGSTRTSFELSSEQSK